MNEFLEHFRIAQPGWLLLLLPALLLPILRRGRGAEAAVMFPNLSVLVSLGRRVRHTAGGFDFGFQPLDDFVDLLGRYVLTRDQDMLVERHVQDLPSGPRRKRGEGAPDLASAPAMRAGTIAVPDLTRRMRDRGPQ